MKVGICGLGHMGSGIAACFAAAGHEVVGWDTRATSATVPLTKDYGDADVVIEAVDEDLDLKVGVLARARPGALLLTTTSGLSVTEMAARLGDRVVAAHFWNPPELMPLVEVVRCESTADEAFDAACELIEGIGKIVVRVERDVPGFIGNRLLHAMWREAISLVEAGVASPEHIDQVARLTFGLRAPAVGPLENMDLVGLGLIETIHANFYGTPSALLSEMVRTGRTFYEPDRSGDTAKRRDKQIVDQLERLR